MADGYIRDMIAAKAEIETLRCRVASQSRLIAKYEVEIEQFRPEPVTAQDQRYQSKAIHERDLKIKALSEQIHVLEIKLSKREERKTSVQQPSEMRMLRAWYPETYL